MQILPNNVLADLVFSKEQTKKLPPKIKQKNLKKIEYRLYLKTIATLKSFHCLLIVSF